MTGVKFLCPVAIRQGDLQKKSGGRSSKVWDLRRSAQRIFRGELISWSTSFMTIVTNITGGAPPFIYPVVRRELRSYGYSYSLLNGELRSYQELPNHILVMVTIIYNQLFFIPEVTRIHEPDPCFILFHPISGYITHVHLTGLFWPMYEVKLM